MRCFVFFVGVLLLNSCILIPYKPPKLSKYKLQQENKVGIKSDSPLRTNGFYYFNYIDTVINKGQWYSGYYRFTSDGELRLTNAVKGMYSPDSLYIMCKYGINRDLDKQFYGYCSASGQKVEMEYIREIRENLTSIFYESVGMLNNNGDTLFIKEWLMRKYNKTESLYRECVFYEFPAD